MLSWTWEKPGHPCVASTVLCPFHALHFPGVRLKGTFGGRTSKQRAGGVEMGLELLCHFVPGNRGKAKTLPTELRDLSFFL